jgi:hypothetical protein
MIHKKLVKYSLFAFTIFFCQIACAQLYEVGSIEIYGNRKTSSDIIYASVSVKEGDSISPGDFKSGDMAAKLRQISGVEYATVNPVCCDTNGNVMLYIGIGETGSVIAKHRNSLLQNLTLPAEMINAYRNLENLEEAAIKKGEDSEDDSHGYALVKYQPARNEQNKFTRFASQNLSILVNVLKNSEYAEHRAAATAIITYSNERKKVVDYLLYAVDDPDEGVRNNATRALIILAGYIRLHPGLKINIPTGPFLKMMNSIVWTDRNKGAGVLMQLSQSRNPKLLNEIKQQALASVIEMAKWKDRAHAYFSFMILGRIAGIDEKLLITKNFSKDYPGEIEAMIGKCCR